MVGNTVLAVDAVTPSLDFRDIGHAKDYTEDGILIYPLDGTILQSPAPLIDPILECTIPPSPVALAPITEESLPSPFPDGDNLPCVSQTQATTHDSDHAPDAGYVSDNESVTSQMDASVSGNVNTCFTPQPDKLHALLSHQYNDGCLEFEVEYSTGDKSFTTSKLGHEH